MALNTGPRADNASLLANAWLSAFLWLALGAGGFALARTELNWRRDLSEDQLFELAPATRALLSRLDDVLVVEAFFTGEVRLGTVQIAKSRLIDQLRELEAQGRGHVRLEGRDPSSSSESRLLAERLGITPVQLKSQQGTSSVQQEVFFGLRLSYAGREQVVPFALPQRLEYDFAEALSKLLRPSAPVVAFVEGGWSPAGGASAFSKARELLAQRVQLRAPATLDAGQELPEGTELLVLARPRELHPRALYCVDQFLQSGGRVLLWLERHEVAARQGSIRALELAGPRCVTPQGEAWIDAEGWLAAYGLELTRELVWDLSSNDRRSGSESVQYPYWVRVLAEGLATEVVAVGRLPGADLFWSHAFASVAPPAGATRTELLRSSSRSWLVPAIQDLRLDVAQLNALSAELLARSAPASRTLALALSGRAPSPFARTGAPGPRDIVEESLAAKSARPAILASSDDTVLSAQREFQLVAFADSDAFSDDFFSAQNQLLLANLVDWLTLEGELVALRARLPRDRRIADFLEQEREARGLSSLRGAVDAAEAARDARREEEAASAASARRWSWMGAALGLSLAVLSGSVLGLRAWERRRLEREVRA